VQSLELFAGAGGLAIGISRAGFQHKALIEWDADACDTLRLNARSGSGHAGDWRIVQEDVGKHDFKQYERSVELLSGGPPCQPFSLGGKHRGHKDHRDMFPEAVRAVREIRPKAFIFENVKGLLRKTFANYYSYIIHQLRFPDVSPRGDEEWTDHLARLERLTTGGKHKGLRYNVVYRVLNAADYGVPQHRWRVLIVGVRADLGFEFCFPDRTHEEDALLHDQWITGEYWERHHIARRERPRMPTGLRARVEKLRGLWQGTTLRPWRTVRDVIGDLPKIAIGESCAKTSNHYLNPGARSYAGHTGSPLDEPAKALKAGDHGVPGGENTLRLPDGSVRYFSVRECARIQTFPDRWVFAGSWTESMRQLGNAVPVDLSELVAKRLAETLDREKLITERLREAARLYPKPPRQRRRAASSV
jgi:DNA (cytosine-5)-methyltransferase 1